MSNIVLREPEKNIKRKRLKTRCFIHDGHLIPRTLAITAYGEMDVSIIDEMPAGRIPIETRWIRPPQLDTVLEWMEKSWLEDIKPILFVH